MSVPDQPKIYHITHVRNLPQIVDAGNLWSDAKRKEFHLDCEIVGMGKIKRRRLEEIEVNCHPGTKVGHYAPFYFCPRSIMLYILHRGNHPDLEYTEGQQPIVHLQADLHTTIEWANDNMVKWAFSDRNAGGRLAAFFNHRDDLAKLNWPAISATDFRDMMTKEGKQAEFLLHQSFPWKLIEKIGVMEQKVAEQIADIVSKTTHKPSVKIERGWYF